MNLEGKYFNEPNNFSLSHLSVIFDMKPFFQQIYKSLSNRIKQAGSWMEAIKMAYSIHLTEEEFVQQWGDHEVGFGDEKKFYRVFKYGYNFHVSTPNGLHPTRQVYKSWFPNSAHFIITSEHNSRELIKIYDPVKFVTDPSYVLQYTCDATEKCLYQSRNLTHVRNHEKICTDQTIYTYKQKRYGNEKTTRDMLIDEGVLSSEDTSHERFVSFDIESISEDSDDFISSKTRIHSAQRAVSIGYCSSFGSFEDVIVREDMTKPSLIKLVQIFLDNMERIQQAHYNLISPKIKETIDLLQKQLLENQSVTDKSYIYQRLAYLKSLTILKVIGHNRKWLLVRNMIQ